ncbi:MAG: GAP family protein [Acidimicrobiales bacterium]
MGQAIGESITFAVGVAISPVPVVAVILMLLSKEAGRNSLAFAAGWAVGIAGALAVVIAVSGSIGTDSGGGPSNGTSTVKLVLGVVLVLLALRQWRNRPAQGEPAHLPKWLEALEDVTPARSGGLGVVLSAVNPKNLLLLIGGGLAIAGAPASPGGMAVAAAVFLVLAASSVVVPVVLYRALGARAERSLESLGTWLQANNAAVMTVLLLVIGVLLIGKGLGGF